MAETEYGEVFREEAVELLEELESSLLELEKKPEDLKLVGRVFRAMHTIKGSGSMFGFEDIAGFTHHVETVLDKVREGIIPVTKELIDLTLASRDHIKALLDATAGEGEVDPEKGRGIIFALEALLSEDSGEDILPEEDTCLTEAPAAEPVEEHDRTTGRLTHYRVHFAPTSAFFKAGGEPQPLFRELCNLGDCSIFAHTEEAVTDKHNYDDSFLFWELLLSTDKGINAIKDVFILAESTSEITITPLAAEGDETFQGHKRLGEILVERGEIDRETLMKVLDQQKPLGEMLIAANLVSPSKIKAALAEQKLTSLKEKAKAAKGADSIRVGADKLDHLINLVGELVVTQARLTQVASHSKDPELVEPVEEVERLTAELRDSVLNVRMLPIGTTFARFKRLVRDLSAELGKEVGMITEGAETELDKNVIDQLGEPLVHLIRNSIDHGIEPPDERAAAGKPRKGTVRLAATHSGANVVITVSDDGRGLDPVVVRAKAIAKGLIKPEDELNEAEIQSMIFMPGFSTAENVTNVSGRGVGMDVVKNTIDGLKGSVEVSSNKKGKGTNVTISLPLTLAIIDGLLVRVGNTHFVLPLSQVEECVELSRDDIARFHGRRMIPVRDRLVPYVRLRNFFRIGGERPDLEQVVIVHIDGECTGLVLDDVVGEHQTVIKSLGWVYRNTVGLSGSTILGNGEVALILDVPRVIRSAQKEEMALFSGQSLNMEQLLGPENNDVIAGIG